MMRCWRVHPSHEMILGCPETRAAPERVHQQRDLPVLASGYKKKNRGRKGAHRKSHTGRSKSEGRGRGEESRAEGEGEGEDLRQHQCRRVYERDENILEGLQNPRASPAKTKSPRQERLSEGKGRGSFLDERKALDEQGHDAKTRKTKNGDGGE